MNTVICQLFGVKNKFNNLFYLKRILNVLLYNHVWESLDTCDLYNYTIFKKNFIIGQI